MADIQETLAARAATHGEFREFSVICQSLKAIIKDSMDTEDPMILEAIDMICHKLARIACGDPTHKDHWHDIAGYAKLVEDRL